MQCNQAKQTNSFRLWPDKENLPTSCLHVTVSGGDPVNHFDVKIEGLKLSGDRANNDPLCCTLHHQNTVIWPQRSTAVAF